MNKKIIGIFGGTFDPIHLGHLQIAEQLLKKLPFSQIRFLPNQIPAHRAEPHASLEHRIKMIELALKSNPQFALDLTETERPGPSYMVDTLKILREHNPDNPKALILGSDAFTHFNTWHRYEEILDYTHLIIVNRPHLPQRKDEWLAKLLDARLTADPQRLSEQASGLIYECELTPIPISATLIREKLAKGESIEEAVPPAVYAYVLEHRIYK
jgi:nicotinate-nucleotide adenylyltransferase